MSPPTRAAPPFAPTAKPVSPNHRAQPAARGRLEQDPTHLRAHVGQCAAARSLLHSLRGAGEAVHAFVCPRLVSTLALSLVAAAALLWLAA